MSYFSDNPNIGTIAKFTFLILLFTNGIPGLSAQDTHDKLTIDYAKTASVARQATRYAKGTLFWGNTASLNEARLISFEYSEAYPKKRYVAISHWESLTKRNIEWLSGDEDPNQAILVGNIDSDPLDEVIVFGGHSMAYGARDTLIVIDWEKGEYIVRRNNEITSDVAGLIDVNLDGINEVVFADMGHDNQNNKEEQIFRTNLVLYTLDGAIKRLADLPLDIGIHALIVDDFNDDGFEEVLSHEYSDDRSVRARLSIYSIGKNYEMKRISSINRFTPSSISYIDSFYYNQERYLFFELSDMNLRTLLRWEGIYGGKAKWTVMDSYESNLFEKAMTRTKVHDPNGLSTERYRNHEYQTVFIR